MYRRLFFLFPSRQETQKFVRELEDLGIAESDIHTFTHDAKQLSGLPSATERQQKGMDVQVEKFGWNTNLGLFFMSLGGFVIALLSGSLAWAGVLLLGMALTYAVGYWFATRLAGQHLNGFRDALHHHEILLTVDVPSRHVAFIERLVRRQHPEAVDGGVGWSLHHFGL